MYYVFWLRICLFVSFKRCINNIFCIGQDRLRWKYHSYFECLWIRYIINVIFYFELFPSIYSLIFFDDYFISIELIIFWRLFYFYWTIAFIDTSSLHVYRELHGNMSWSLDQVSLSPKNTIDELITHFFKSQITSKMIYHLNIYIWCKYKNSIELIFLLDYLESRFN